MADGISVDASGLNQLTADLLGASRRARHEASAIVRDSIDAVVGTAQAIVPVDTRRTQRSIHAAAAGTDRPPAAGDLDVEAGPTTHYAPDLEYGTSKMGPRAFMGPALDRHTPQFVERMQRLGGL